MYGAYGCVIVYLVVFKLVAGHTVFLVLCERDVVYMYLFMHSISVLLNSGFT